MFHYGMDLPLQGEGLAGFRGRNGIEQKLGSKATTFHSSCECFVVLVGAPSWVLPSWSHLSRAHRFCSSSFNQSTNKEPSLDYEDYARRAPPWH